MSLFSKKKNNGNLNDDDFWVEEKKPAISSPYTLTPQEVSEKDSADTYFPDSSSALDSLRKRIANAQMSVKSLDEQPEKPEEPKEPEQNKTLLEKCLPYIIDENGKDASVDTEPLYKLQSVAEILKSKSEETLEKLSKQYGITVEDLRKSDDSFLTETEKTEESDNESGFTKVISDVDASETPKKEEPEQDCGATVTFTPVANGNTGNIKVSTYTKQLDLTNELVKLPESISESETSYRELEKDEFDDFKPKHEIKNEKDYAKYRKLFSIRKRNSFLASVITVLITAVIGFLRLPFIAGYSLTSSNTGMIICAAFTAVSLIANIGIFASFPKIFSKKGSSDVPALLAAVFSSLYIAFGIIKQENVIDVIILLNFILALRSVCKFKKYSYLLYSLKTTFQNGNKNAVRLISDPAVTFAMAKNSIEGDVLIAALQDSEREENFMKYSEYGNFLGGKLPILTAVSLILSVVSAFACLAFFKVTLYGFYAAAAVECLFALPSVFFIDVFPLYRTFKRLMPYKSALFGIKGAEILENANAMVIDATDIFPDGSITLKQMKVLSENSLDDTIIRAAALAEYMNSPLTPVFKSIVKTGDISVLPDADTVKYEDRMGISGWVDNRLLFIGNRALMEAHSIEVPSLEVDRKILRKGYFPVYLATREKVCALFIVEYNVKPNIIKELRSLSGLGITLLVNSSDQNLTDSMICDYAGLYADSVKVMSAAGCHMYKNASTDRPNNTSPAVLDKGGLCLAALLNCANKIKQSNIYLTVSYIICAVLGIVIFAYASFGSSGTVLSPSALLIYSAVTTVLSYFAYLVKRP